MINSQADVRVVFAERLRERFNRRLELRFGRGEFTGAEQCKTESFAAKSRFSIFRSELLGGQVERTLAVRERLRVTGVEPDDRQ